MNQKHQLRQEMLAQRAALDPNWKRAYDQLVCNMLWQIITEKKCQIVHSFLPMGDEINLYPFIQTLLNHSIKVLCPQTLPKRRLNHLQLHSLEQLEDGRFGTRHPANTSVHEGAIDLIIVPGLAFDKANNRLGYGAGYYDVFLAEHPEAYTVAVAYPFQIVEEVPVEGHDVGVEEVVCFS